MKKIKESHGIIIERTIPTGEARVTEGRGVTIYRQTNIAKYLKVSYKEYFIDGINKPLDFVIYNLTDGAKSPALAWTPKYYTPGDWVWLTNENELKGILVLASKFPIN